MSSSRVQAFRRDLRHTLLARRRLLAAIFAALAVAAAVQAARPAPDATQPVVTAAVDLRAGDVLGPDDVAIVEAEPELVPEGRPRSSRSALRPHPRGAGPRR